jgi:hypothetical protein
MKDELITNFVTAGLGASDDPNVNNTVGASAPTEIAVAPFRSPVREYVAPPSNLLESVSAAQVASESRARTYNVAPGSRSPLAGTSVEESDNEV